MEIKDNLKKAGKNLGFLTMFFVFTTVLYFVLKLTNRLPEDWNYLYVLLLTLAITLTGILTRLFLK